MNQFEQVIRENIALSAHPNAKGWFSTLCKVCNDHGRKGPRAAFIFTEEGGGAYHCFNCGIKASYDPTTDTSFESRMLEVMESFNIPSHDQNKILLSNLINPAQKRTLVTNNEHEPAEISLLPFFYPLTDNQEDDWCLEAIEYLTSRNVDWTSQPFYCVSKQENHPDNARWYGRLVIPIYKNNKLIFYQGRDIVNVHHKKYLNPPIPRDKILYGFDRLFEHTDDPLYITEGWFDAVNIQGVAVFSNQMTAHQLYWLNKSKRQKVIIPDRFGNGHLLARQGIDQGWSISLPDAPDCKDVGECVEKYGLLYTLSSIQENITSGVAASVLVNIHCKGDKNDTRTTKFRRKR